MALDLILVVLTKYFFLSFGLLICTTVTIYSRELIDLFVNTKAFVFIYTETDTQIFMLFLYIFHCF